MIVDTHKLKKIVKFVKKIEKMKMKFFFLNYYIFYLRLNSKVIFKNFFLNK